jgi:hypothetical protein
MCMLLTKPAAWQLEQVFLSPGLCRGMLCATLAVVSQGGLTARILSVTTGPFSHATSRPSQKLCCSSRTWSTCE